MHDPPALPPSQAVEKVDSTPLDVTSSFRMSSSDGMGIVIASLVSASRKSTKVS